MGAKRPHANSLKNLIPGGGGGTKVKVTKSLVQKLTTYIEKDMPTFLAQIESLSTRDQVAAKMKILDMILPKKREVESSTTTENIEWKIQAASVALPPASLQAASEVVEGEVIELKNEEDD